MAVGLLVGKLEEDAVAGGLELGEVDGAGGAESHDLEGVGLAGGGRGRDEASGQEGSEENGLDLHGDGCGGVVVVVVLLLLWWCCCCGVVVKIGGYKLYCEKAVDEEISEE